jgi:hypothetical protein
MIVFNGFYLRRSLSGYSPCSFDITDYVDYGGQNLIEVRVDASLSEGWYYEGAGIYRHTWLTKTHPCCSEDERRVLGTIPLYRGTFRHLSTQKVLGILLRTAN